MMLPIEIKGPWQSNTKPWETLVDLMNGGECSRGRVKNAIAQIFMNMKASMEFCAPNLGFIFSEDMVIMERSIWRFQGLFAIIAPILLHVKLSFIFPIFLFM